MCGYIFLLKNLKPLLSSRITKILLRKKTGDFICCLRIDKGGEFTSHEFNIFCKTNDISRQLTTTYISQQNGVAEHKNRTIRSMVKSILSEKQVPKNFGAKSNILDNAHVQQKSYMGSERYDS